jgi:hypothetical protein
MQDILPKSIIFLTQTKNVDKVQLTCNTVIEDAGARDVGVEIFESEISKISQTMGNLNTSFFNLLVERDFLLPEFGQRSMQFFSQNNANNIVRHTFWQRTDSGASKAVTHQSNLNHQVAPLSTLMLMMQSEAKYEWVDNFNENFECNVGDLVPDWVEGNNCVIQSNRQSAFAPKMHLRQKN